MISANRFEAVFDLEVVVFIVSDGAHQQSQSLKREFVLMAWIFPGAFQKDQFFSHSHS